VGTAAGGLAGTDGEVVATGVAAAARANNFSPRFSRQLGETPTRYAWAYRAGGMPIIAVNSRVRCAWSA
jgi:hypothetical protein